MLRKFENIVGDPSKKALGVAAVTVMRPISAGLHYLEGDDVESVYTKDQLLTNIMVYIVTRTFNTASWIYYGRREEGGRVFSPEGKRVEVPTGCALFPAELLAWPPRSYAERIYNITQWTEMPRGGHFAAMEQPDLLVADIRKFARSLD